jgi:hypothetical protein
MRLYCVLYKDGVVKVGYSTWVQQRIRGLSRRAQVLNSWASAEIDGPTIETKALNRLRKIANTLPRKREWFIGLRFAVAVQLCQQVIRDSRRL